MYVVLEACVTACPVAYLAHTIGGHLEGLQGKNAFANNSDAYLKAVGIAGINCAKPSKGRTHARRNLPILVPSAT